jgi:hypothetical protein
MKVANGQEGIMFSQNRIRLLLVFTLVLLTAFSVESKPRKMQRVSTGSWGGPNIMIQVGASSATVEYACANSTIEGPLTFDSKGRFTWHGAFNREGPGPIRVDDAGSNSQRAIYTGTVKGDTMTLTVKLAGSSDAIGTYTLKRGAAGRVFKCK